MIEAVSTSIPWQTDFSDGIHRALGDTTTDKGGGGGGFRPHDLLEAALACCVNMTIRMYAGHHAIALQGVHTKVSLDRSQPGQALFRYWVELEGELTAQDRERLLRAAQACPVRRTLSGGIDFACETA